MSRPAAERYLHAVPEPGTASAGGLLDAPVPMGLRSRVADPSAHAHDLARHTAAYGSRPSAGGPAGAYLLGALDAVRLTGRGGGHFPVAAKWRTALAAGGGGTVVANGAEGEPASAKDAALLQLRPHLVLDGLTLAAETVGTRDAVVWLHEGDHATQRAVEEAVFQRRSAGDFAVAVRIAIGPDHYLSGESSSVVRALSGGPALPYLARTPAAVSGIGGRPTLIHNAETLARVALVARTGDRPYLDGGQGALVTLIGPAGRVVDQVDAGETFADLLRRHGSDDPAGVGRPSAVLVGGYGGSWLSWSDLAPLEVSDTALRPLGASLGAGVLVPIGSSSCGLVATARLLAYLAASSANQCGPCMFGLPDIAALWDRLATGRASRADHRTLDRFLAQVAGRGACHHPDGAVRLARSALATFAADVRLHLDDGPCAAALAAPWLPFPGVS